MFTCATSPTAVGTVTSTEAMTSAAVPWPRSRVTGPTPPSPTGGLIQKQTPQTPLISHVCPRKATFFAGRPLTSYSAAALLIPPPHSLVRSKHPQSRPGPVTSATASSQSSCAATSTKLNDHRGRLVVSFAAASPGLPPQLSFAATRPQSSLRITIAGPRTPPFCQRGFVHRSDAPCGSPVKLFAVAVPASAHPPPRGLVGDIIPQPSAQIFLQR